MRLTEPVSFVSKQASGFPASPEEAVDGPYGAAGRDAERPGERQEGVLPRVFSFLFCFFFRGVEQKPVGGLVSLGVLDARQVPIGGLRKDETKRVAKELIAFNAVGMFLWVLSKSLVFVSFTVLRVCTIWNCLSVSSVDFCLTVHSGKPRLIPAGVRAEGNPVKMAGLHWLALTCRFSGTQVGTERKAQVGMSWFGSNSFPTSQKVEQTQKPSKVRSEWRTSKMGPAFPWFPFKGSQERVFSFKQGATFQKGGGVRSLSPCINRTARKQGSQRAKPT